MFSGNNKYPFFEKLRTVAATLSNDINDIKKKLPNSKFELPENNAMFKLVQLGEDMKTYKNDSCALLQQLTGENEKYAHYRQDIANLVSEMERNTDKVEELLGGYGYQKWHPEQMSPDDCGKLESASNHTTPLKKASLEIDGADSEREKQVFLQKTPVLADYGITAKVPKYLPSALKDKQESSLKSTKKQVHFESPPRQTEGKENKLPYSLQKTPLLQDYGLPSGKRRYLMPDTKDSVCIKKQLTFRSPLGSISEFLVQKDTTETLVAAEVDSTENFRALVSSIPSGVENPPLSMLKSQIDENIPLYTVQTSTPEEPIPLSSQRIKYACSKKNENVTPEEPEIQPLRTAGMLKNKDNSETPEEPVATPLSHTFKDNSETPEEPVATPLSHTFLCTKSDTPKTPEFLVTRSLRDWLQSQKEKVAQ